MKLNSARDFGGLVRQTRRDCKLTQRQLAERVGVSRDWIIRLEQGKSSVELALVLRTLKALNLAVFVHRVQAGGSGDGTVDLKEILVPQDTQR